MRKRSCRAEKEITSILKLQKERLFEAMCTQSHGRSPIGYLSQQAPS